MSTETQSQQLSSPSGGAHVAGADMGSDAQVNGQPVENACPAGTSKLDDHGRGDFPENIEAEWLRYIAYQEARLSAAGEKSPYVALHSPGSGRAGSYGDISGEMSRAATLNEAVNQRIEFLGSAEARKAAKIAKLQRELAELKGEGGAAK